MKQIDYRIRAEIHGQKPDIQLEVKFKDDFTNDHYILKTLANDENINDIPFVVFKNEEEFNRINLKEKNVNLFLNNFLDLTEDFDFKKEFEKKLFDQIEKELGNFFQFFEDAIILKGLTLEGEKNRMKKLSGIIKG